VFDFLKDAGRGAIILDLGCGTGSFQSGGDSFRIFGVDQERPETPPRNFVQADAAQIPFPAGHFDFIIANHSLEHVTRLEETLCEIDRVIRPGGALYVAVPDSTTISDRLYRWLARGGGHVNHFSSARELASMIASATTLRHAAVRPPGASLSFLNRHNHRRRPPRRLLLLGGGIETTLLLASYCFRLVDRFLGTRLSFYGWVLYFGSMPAGILEDYWTNVCIRCGSGVSSDRLAHDLKLVRRLLFVSTYRCPVCGALNLFTEDRHYRRFSRM
jgi:SAM-dependent methyltransferase